MRSTPASPQPQRLRSSTWRRTSGAAMRLAKDAAACGGGAKGRREGVSHVKVFHVKVFFTSRCFTSRSFTELANSLPKARVDRDSNIQYFSNGGTGFDVGFGA